jgi:uncharacterized protein
MKHLLLLFALALSLAIPMSAQTPTIVGDWHGTLKVGSAELRLVLHITKSDDGALHATLDSLDQGANGIPVSSITFKDSKLNFTSDAVHGSYEGNADKDLTVIRGTWTQSTPLPLDFSRGAFPTNQAAEAKPSDIDGTWLGTLDTGAMKLRVAFHIKNTSDGLTATMDSLDQGANGIPASSVTRDGSTLKMEFKGIGGAFEGKLDPKLENIDGTWSQGGGSAPLSLHRAKDAAELAPPPRPQEPTKPYPYKVEDVSYPNPAAAGVRLAATITIPPGSPPFPAVLLIAGSGPHDRDESVFGHRPFLVLSDYLTRKGIVVLRADKRGIGKSTGDYASATSADFASDAEAGVAYLVTRPEVDRRKIGLIGHSEGGVIAPMVAAHEPTVAFIVLMAGSGVPGDQIIVAQTLHLAEASGQSRELSEKDAAEERKIVTMVEQEKDDAVLASQLRAELAANGATGPLDAPIKALMSPWYRYFLSYDPATALHEVKCPVLALIGSKDLQVPADLNLPAIREALEAGGNKNFEVDELPGLNHLFQSAKTGAISEYSQISETISPLALAKISSWILKQTSHN